MERETSVDGTSMLITFDDHANASQIDSAYLTI